MKKFAKKNSGSSTLEILLAFAILTLIMSAVIMLGFGNQSATVDSETNSEALFKASALVEKARADSREDFFSVFSNSQTESSGFLTYEKKLEVFDINPCRKEISSLITWNEGTNRPQSVEINTVLTSVSEALGLGGDCNHNLSGGGDISEWLNPQTFETLNIHPGGNQGTDIDVLSIDGKSYAILTSIHSNQASDDFWIIDISSSPASIVSSMNTGPGLNAVDAGRLKDGKYYAFVANNKNTAPYEQLIIIDISNPSSPVEIARASLPGVSGSDPEGRAVYLYKEKVYVGTRRTAGEEFHIFNVSNPSALAHIGKRELNHSIRKIVIRGEKAYLATTADDNELIVLNVEDPTNIYPAWGGVGTVEPGFDALGNENGTALYLLGDKIYLGRARTAGGRPEFYILKEKDYSIIGSVNAGLSPSNAVIEDLEVVGNLAFLGTGDSNKEFQVWDISNPVAPIIRSSFNFPQAISGIEFHNNKIYTSVRSNSALHVIYDAP